MSIIVNGVELTEAIYAGVNLDIVKVKKGTAEAVTVFEKITQLATPQNVTADGTTVSWDAVENAKSYAVLADGSEIGTVEGAATKILAAGTYKWKDVPNFTGAPASTLFDFLDINGSSYFGVGITGTTSGYVNYFTNSGGTSWQTAFDIENEFWENTAYKTITIATDQQISAEFYDWAITGGNLVQKSAAGT